LADLAEDLVHRDPAGLGAPEELIVIVDRLGGGGEGGGHRDQQRGRDRQADHRLRQAQAVPGVPQVRRRASYHGATSR